MKLLKNLDSFIPLEWLLGILIIAVILVLTNIAPIKHESGQVLLFKEADSIIVKSLDTTIYKIEELNTAYIITYNKGGFVTQVKK